MYFTVFLNKDDDDEDGEKTGKGGGGWGITPGSPNHRHSQDSTPPASVSFTSA